jgi:hypothetical protein
MPESGNNFSIFVVLFAVFHVTDAAGNKVTDRETVDFIEKVSDSVLN